MPCDRRAAGGTHRRPRPRRRSTTPSRCNLARATVAARRAPRPRWRPRPHADPTSDARRRGPTGCCPTPRRLARRVRAPRRPAASSSGNAAPTPPVDFVPSGDARFDRLRLIYAAGLTPKKLSADAEAIGRVTAQLAPQVAGAGQAGTQGSAAQGVRRSLDSRSVAAGSSATDAGSIDRSPAGSRSVGHGDSAARDGRRGDTTAGPATGPGGLGRRVRPEPVTPRQMSDRTGATTALPGSFPTASPGAPAGDQRADSVSSGQNPARAAASAPRARPAQPARGAVRRTADGPLSTAEIDALRQGMQARRDAKQRASDPKSSSPSAAGAETTTQPRTSAGSSTDVSAPPSGSPSPSGSLSPSGSPSPAGSLSTAESPSARRTPSQHPGNDPGSTGLEASSRGTTQTIAREFDITPQYSTDPLPLASRDLSIASALATSEATVAPPIALAERTANLRLQRMIAAGRVPVSADAPDQAAQRTADAARRRAADGAESRWVGSEATSPTQHGDTVTVSAPDRNATDTSVSPSIGTRAERPHRARRRVPVLPGVGTQPDAVIRRLSIPRAMSAIHRPENRLSALPTAPPAAGLTPVFDTVDAFGFTASGPSSAGPRASVMSPLSPSLSPLPDESRSSAGFEADLSVATNSPPRALRRQRVSHLINDWSLVKGSPGALGHAIHPSAAHRARPAVTPVRRSVADPSVAADRTSMRITQPTRSPRGATLHRVGGVVQRTPNAPDEAGLAATATDHRHGRSQRRPTRSSRAGRGCRWQRARGRGS